MKILVESGFDLYVDRITEIAKTSSDVIQLQWGELAGLPPKRIIDYVREAYELGLTRYSLPQGSLELRRAIQEKLLKKNKINVDTENIIVTVGGTAAINFIFRVIAGDGGYIIVQDPTWFGYPGIAGYVGARIYRVPERDYSYESLESAKKDIEAKGGELRGVVVNYPANPTGFVFDEKTLKEIVEFARDNDILVISDEAYEDYVFYGEHRSIASISGIENIVSVFTFSKTYSFTGIRIGYAVGEKNIIGAISLAQVHTYISPPSIEQYIALKLMENNDAEEIVRKNLALLRKNMELAKEYINKNNWECMEAKGGIYVFMRLPNVDTTKFALKLLEKYRVAVAPGIDFGDKWSEWIRITIAKPESEVEEGLKRIEKLYGEWKR